jgi:hypothetical protein
MEEQRRMEEWVLIQRVLTRHHVTKGSTTKDRKGQYVYCPLIVARCARPARGLDLLCAPGGVDSELGGGGSGRSASAVAPCRSTCPCWSCSREALGGAWARWKVCGDGRALLL